MTTRRIQPVILLVLPALVWILVLAGVAVAQPTANPEPVAKVISRYALTAANDFPQRDPFDWRLRASRDGGKTWITLDERKGELFSQRQQRRVFEIARPAAFSLYRLQIDRVREPATANAVQIAEIELLGKGEPEVSVRPLFADSITAQGANPPAEAPLRAFDGRVETKWLDRSQENAGSRASWIQWQYFDHPGLVVTNIAQLSSLRERAVEGYALKIEGVIVGRSGNSTGFYLLDNSGYIEVENSPAATALLPGQAVIVTGKSDWLNQRVVVAQPDITITATQTKAEPQKMELGDRLPAEEKFRWVEVEGTVQFRSWLDSRKQFELADNGHSLSVIVLSGDSDAALPAVGSRIGVRGVCADMLDANGDHIIGTLWTPSGALISTVSQPFVASRRAVATTVQTNEAGFVDIEQVTRLSQEVLDLRPKVKARGVVIEALGSYIQQGAKGIEVDARDTNGSIFPAQTFGSFVEIEGEATWAAQRGPVIAINSSKRLGRGKLPDPIRPSWGQLASGQMDATWIEVSAVVRATDGSHLLLDSDGRQMMATIRSAPYARVKQLIDASVRMRGVCINATDERGIVQGIQLAVPSLEFVEVVKPAPPVVSMPVQRINDLYQVGSGIDFNHRVKVRGVLTLREGRKFFLQDATGGLMAMGQADVVLADVAQGARWVFWQSPESDDLAVAAEEFDGFVPGDEIEVIGFLSTRGYAPVLTEALVNRVGQAKPQPPVNTTAQVLSLGRLDSMVVQVEGRVLGQEILGTHFVMQIQSADRVFQAALRGRPRNAPKLESGSRVQLTGVCQMDPGVHAELGKSPATFSLLLRSAEDVLVLESPPWWTPQRALTVVGVLALVLCAAVVWIRMLHRQVDEKTKLLKAEITEHEKTEARLAEETKSLQREAEEHRRTEAILAEKTRLLESEIEERKRAEAKVEKVHKQLLSASRLAGMADVATNVLHNVGNVLNSVNVLASYLNSALQKSKMPGVARLATLLKQQQPDLGRFIMEDENGKLVPAHLERLGARLEEEHAGLLEKTSLLTDSIQHVKEIVAMQQNYAKIAGVAETLSVAEVVEDALRMCDSALARHGVEVVRDYAEISPVMLDRHKLLQILFNLLDNAKHACEASANQAKRVTVRLSKQGLERVRIEIKDNGVGIPRENLARIFTQGFSTRKGGHGFGLHGSILAAQDMGGALLVHSDGDGAGATFTLELPGPGANGNLKSNPEAEVGVV